MRYTDERFVKQMIGAKAQGAPPTKKQSGWTKVMAKELKKHEISVDLLQDKKEYKAKLDKIFFIIRKPVAVGGAKKGGESPKAE